MPGPLPDPNKRRRNAPTIATTELPAAGRKGRPPALPNHYTLRKTGRAFWKWAWKLPQATAWDKGALYVVARRAQLEDDLQVLENVGDITVALGLEENEAARELEWVFGRLKGIASGRNQVMREMRELDNRLGLNPKAMSDLRWSIAEPEPTKRSKQKKAQAAVANLDEYRDRLG